MPDLRSRRRANGLWTLLDDPCQAVFIDVSRVMAWYSSLRRVCALGRGAGGSALLQVGCLKRGLRARAFRNDACMTLWQVLRWVGVAVGLSALVVFFALVGLDRADQLSSVLSLFVTVAGFVLAVVSHVRQQSASGPSPVARGGSIAAGGSVRGSTAIDTGTGAAPSVWPAAPPGGVGPSADSGSIAAGGDVDDSEARRGS